MNPSGVNFLLISLNFSYTGNGSFIMSNVNENFSFKAPFDLNWKSFAGKESICQ